MTPRQKKPKQPPPKPKFSLLKDLQNLGYKTIVGVDEVGRGALAGPICVAAVELNISIDGIDDSKRLSATTRQTLSEQIKLHANLIRFGWATNHEIDQFGVTKALNLAYERALVSVQADLILTDNIKPPYTLKHIRAVRGDQLFYPVSAASIVAKVCRDQLMQTYHQFFPEYDWIHNVGYGTKKHLYALKNIGPSKLHRRLYID